MFVCLRGVNGHIWGNLGERGYRSTPKGALKTDSREPCGGRLLWGPIPLSKQASKQARGERETHTRGTPACRLRHVCGLPHQFHFKSTERTGVTPKFSLGKTVACRGGWQQTSGARNQGAFCCHPLSMCAPGCWHAMLCMGALVLYTKHSLNMMYGMHSTAEMTRLRIQSSARGNTKLF